MNWNKGDIGYHKATMKRLVVSSVGNSSHNMNRLFVTLSDGVKENYAPEEVWTEAEWNARNANQLGAVTHEPDFDPY